MVYNMSTPTKRVMLNYKSNQSKKIYNLLHINKFYRKLENIEKEKSIDMCITVDNLILFGYPEKDKVYPVVSKYKRKEENGKIKEFEVLIEFKLKNDKEYVNVNEKEEEISSSLKALTYKIEFKWYIGYCLKLRNYFL